MAMCANRAWAFCTHTHVFTNVQFRFVTKPCLPDGQAYVCDTSDFQPIRVHLSRDESGDETQRLFAQAAHFSSTSRLWNVTAVKIWLTSTRNCSIHITIKILLTLQYRQSKSYKKQSKSKDPRETSIEEVIYHHPWADESMIKEKVGPVVFIFLSCCAIWREKLWISMNFSYTPDNNNIQSPHWHYL